MGRSGCAFVKYSTDCACTSGKLPSGTWLGTVYGCDHPGCECTGQTDCIHAVGKTGTEQDSDADQSKASDSDSTASKPTVCVPGIFRMQAFQQGEWIFAGEWCGTNWLADWEYIKTDGILPSEKTSEWGVPRHQRRLGYYEKIYQVLKTYFRFIYEFIVTVICE